MYVFVEFGEYKEAFDVTLIWKLMLNALCDQGLFFLWKKKKKKKSCLVFRITIFLVQAHPNNNWAYLDSLSGFRKIEKEKEPLLASLIFFIIF